MKKLALAAILLLLLASTAYGSSMLAPYKVQDYQFHKHTIYLKVHWNITKTDSDTVVAEGFVEPFNHDEGLRGVQLELVGLDEQGNVVNSSSGTPKYPLIDPTFYPASPFRITMKLNGKEKALTITGSYYHYEIGRLGRFEEIDYIPIGAK